MSVFETVKANVTVRQAAERYGLKATRRNMCCCPFHADHHPSMQLNDTYYHCHGCHASGDVISLVSKLTGLSPCNAAAAIARDFGINAAGPPGPVKRPVTVFHLRYVLKAYGELLKKRIAQSAPAHPDDDLSDAFCEAINSYEQNSAMLDMLYSPDPDDQREVMAELMEGDRLIKLEEQIKKEDNG